MALNNMEAMIALIEDKGLCDGPNGHCPRGWVSLRFDWIQ